MLALDKTEEHEETEADVASEEAAGLRILLHFTKIDINLQVKVDKQYLLLRSSFLVYWMRELHQCSASKQPLQQRSHTQCLQKWWAAAPPPLGRRPQTRGKL